MTTKANPNGKLIEKGALLLRTNVGTASLGKTSYELTTGVSCAPLIKNLTTGLTFSFTWEDLINQARDAGIDGE